MRDHACGQNFVHKVVGQRFPDRPDEIGFRQLRISFRGGML
jgi:hypothetical protein